MGQEVGKTFQKKSFHAPRKQVRPRADVKDLLAKVYSEDDFIEDFELLRKSKDERIRLEILKLALSYQYGKPIQPVVGEEIAPRIKIDISAIPSYRVPVSISRTRASHVPQGVNERCV